MNKNVTEAKIQQEIFIYHWNRYPEERKLLFMVHNEAMNRIRGSKLKTLGMVRGVSDMIYLNPKGLQPIFMEVKTESGRQSKWQKEWENVINNNTVGIYAVVRSLEEAKKLCTWTR